jgi:hypothetical protein
MRLLHSASPAHSRPDSACGRLWFRLAIAGAALIGTLLLGLSKLYA